MTSEADRNCPDHKDFIDAIEYLKDPWNKEKLQRLLSDESWERFVAAANLSRDKADALYADLSQLEQFVAVEDKLNKEWFIKEFPRAKQNLKERIGKVYTLADEVDKMHRDCTIAQVVAASSGAASGLLTISGLGLATFTAGTSGFISVIGLGLSITAGVTGVTANIMEMSKDASAKDEASRLGSTGSDIEKVVKELLSRMTPRIASLTEKCFPHLKYILKKADVLSAEEYNSILAEASGFMRTGAVFTQTGLQLKKAFGSTAKDLGKGVRIFGAAVAGVFLLMDVWDLVKKSEHLQKGAKSQTAGELRQQAQELERRLEELTCIHKSLQEATNKQGNSRH